MRDMKDLSTKWLKVLTEPHPAVTDPQQRQTTRVLAGVTLTLMVLDALAGALYYVFVLDVVGISLVSEVIFMAVYLLSRSRRPVAGSWLLVISISCAIFATIAGAEYPVSGMSWIIFPTMLAAILLTIGATLAVTLLNLIAAFLYVVLTPAAHFDAAIAPLLTITVAGWITLFVKYVHERDIRTLKHQTRELTTSRQRYRDLFDNVPIGLYQIDPLGQILRANKACARLLGFSNPDALIDVNMHALFVDTARREQWRHLLEREGTLSRFEWQVQFPDGRRVWVAESAHMVKDSAGRPLYYQGSIEDITLQRQARQEMLRQKEYWEALIVHSPVAIVTLDPQHNVISVNTVFESLFGYRLDQVIGHNLDALIVPHADKVDAAELTGKVLAKGETVHTITQRQRRDGTLVDIELDAAPVILDGEQVGALAVYQDITQRKVAERELIGRQARLEMLNKVAFRVAEMTQLSDIMTTIVEYARWVADADVAVIAALDLQTGHINEVYSANYPMESIPVGTEIAGRGVLGLVLRGNIVHSPDVTQEADYVGYPGWHPRIRACLGVPVKYGERVLAVILLGNLTPERNFSSQDREVVLTLSHLAAVAMHTAHQFAELNKAIAFQQKTLDTAATAIYTVDTDLRITSINDAFTEITGYTEDEIIGKPCSLFEGNPCLRHCGLFNPQRTAPIYRQECEVTAKSGQRLTIIKNAELVYDERGQVVGGIESFIDVTALIVARREAEAASRAKGEFLANMSHELRTPLNAILGFAQLMQRSASFPEEHRQSLQIISRSGENLLELINDILDMSKIEAGRTTLDPDDFDLHATLESVLSMLNVRAEKKGLRLTLQCAPDVPQFVRTDERKLRQVLINLLGNAVKFTPQGSITLRVMVNGIHDDVDQKKSSYHLRFEIQDTGVGIAPEEMDTLFEAFTQTESGRRSKEGTGLGLPISRQFVRMMGGDLTVQSQPDQGSNFTFDIQVEHAQEEHTVMKQPARQVIGLMPDQPEYRILVVDDREENRILIRKLLEEVGFSVHEAADGQEAIKVHARWRPHLIFMDMRMPVMDGYEATQRIKATLQGQATVIVALTASALEENRTVSFSVGCDDFVRKPFHDADIFDALARHLNVRYIYADQDQAIKQHDATPPSGAQLTPQMLTTLPAEWLAQLRDVATRARGDLVLDLVAQIEAEHAPVATALVQLVDEFQFDRIIALLKRP
jgi:two-component system sensor histidine kinase/response regulator